MAGEGTRMSERKKSNLIPVIHRLVTDENGENYWFNGCAKYVMECLGEKDYDYWFFAGITGDLFTQHFARNISKYDAVSTYRRKENSAEFIEELFKKCGYDATYVSNQELRNNRELYLDRLISYIDQSVPVIAGRRDSVFVGYEDYGKTLLYITGNSAIPESILLEKEIYEEADEMEGWTFVGAKKTNRPLVEIYREAVIEIPQNMCVNTESYCFGPDAFSEWAKDIESGRFDVMKAEEFDTWAHYTNYVCVLATNGCCCHNFLKRAQKLNPDFGFLEEISAKYRRMAEIWGGEGSQNEADSLEALGGGFNITLKTLQDQEQRKKIAAKIRECAEVAEDILRVWKSGLEGIKEA